MLTRALLFTAALLAASSVAHADEWVKIGQRQVAFGGDRDTITATHKGRFNKIKLKVEGNAIHVNDLKLHFGNGGMQDVSVRKNIPMGGSTRVIDLSGGNRVVNRIVMTYRTKMKRPRARGKATVTVYGRLATGAAPQSPKVTPAPKATPKAPVKKVEWELLGSRKVQFSADQDTIPVTASEGRFAKMKLKILDNPIHLIDLKVFYGNGEVQDVKVAKDFAKGGETRVIDLSGGSRVIKKVRLRYKTKLGVKRLLRGQATVKVFALRVQGGAPAPAATPKPATPKPAAPAAGSGNWERLGARTVKRRAEQDTIMVTAKDGRFTKLKFKVKNSALKMLDMKVHYGNGERQDVPLRFDIPAGGESRVIDLSGNKRVIQKVVFRYKSARDGRGRAEVVLWGRH
jgi:hypothetical protein